MKKMNYKDFIGEIIRIEFAVPSQMCGQSTTTLLEKELYRRIKKSLGWTNGLIWRYDSYKEGVENNLIFIQCRVTRCEVDC